MGAGIVMDEKDRRLLGLLQDSFPLDPDPWGVAGMRLGMTRDEVMGRVTRLREAGILRSIGPVLEAGRVGIGASTLVAMRVPPGRIDEISRMINSYRQVSHNYLRDNGYNLWFTLAARDRAELSGIIGEIRSRAGPEGASLLDLPGKRRFKIDVRFPIDGNGNEGSATDAGC